MSRKCGYCNGTGFVATAHGPHYCYRVFIKYQDSDWCEPQEFPSFSDAAAYKAAGTKSGNCMMQIVSPLGQVLG